MLDKAIEHGKEYRKPYHLNIARWKPRPLGLGRSRVPHFLKNDFVFAKILDFQRKI